MAPHPSRGDHHRGYSPIGQERVKHLNDSLLSNDQGGEDGDCRLNLEEGMDGDLKESFESGREDCLVEPNIWPPGDVLPGFREMCMDYFWVCSSLRLFSLLCFILRLHPAILWMT